MPPKSRCVSASQTPGWCVCARHRLTAMANTAPLGAGPMALALVGRPWPGRAITVVFARSLLVLLSVLPPVGYGSCPPPIPRSLLRLVSTGEQVQEVLSLDQKLGPVQEVSRGFRCGHSGRWGAPGEPWIGTEHACRSGGSTSLEDWPPWCVAMGSVSALGGERVCTLALGDRADCWEQAWEGGLQDGRE